MLLHLRIWDYICCFRSQSLKRAFLTFHNVQNSPIQVVTREYLERRKYVAMLLFITSPLPHCSMIPKGDFMKFTCTGHNDRWNTEWIYLGWIWKCLNLGYHCVQVVRNIQSHMCIQEHALSELHCGNPHTSHEYQYDIKCFFVKTRWWLYLAHVTNIKLTTICRTPCIHAAFCCYTNLKELCNWDHA